MENNDRKLQIPSRTAEDLSIHAIDGPSSQVAGIKRVFSESAPAGDSSGYRNAARKWPLPPNNSSRMLMAKSARKTPQEWNPSVNRKSVNTNPMLHPVVSRYLDVCVARGNEQLPIRLREPLRPQCLQLLDMAK